nr:PREDICTED: CDKN2A-interacting protein isoform X1 [Anolis carolinensis]|eukprot:XP_003221661.1 PREDICTED: CDKN2A-interacting protein isoform X1 [Anolis carolinensis]
MADGGGGGGSEEMGEAGDGEAWVERLRAECEPEHHWKYRREFLLRNGGEESREEEGAELRRLISFSMVWANHVFLGCRYPPEVMEKVMDMAAGITVTNAPTHTLRDDLVSKVKRRISSSNEGSEEFCKKRAMGTDKPSEVGGNDIKTTKVDVPMEVDAVKSPGKETSKTPEKPLPLVVAQKASSSSAASTTQTAVPATSTSVSQKTAPTVSTVVAQTTAATTSAAVAQKPLPTASTAVTQNTTPTTSTTGRSEAKVSNIESLASTKHKSTLASSLPGSESKMNYSLTKPPESKSVNALSSEKKLSSESTAALKSSLHTSAVPVKIPCRLLTSEDAKERQPFFNRLYKAVAWKLVSVGGFSPTVNHAELLDSSIQSVKATLDVEFVPLKELADLPQNKSSQENVVCELRCKSVYLGTGCGKSKENAKAVASREALKLFLKKKVVVKLCKRKYKGREMEDLVLLDEESKPLNLPPALRNPQELLQNSEVVTEYTSK